MLNMLQQLTKSVLLAMTLILRLYNTGAIDYIRFRDNSEIKIIFLKKNLNKINSIEDRECTRKILKEYENILKHNDDNISCKR